MATKPKTTTALVSLKDEMAKQLAGLSSRTTSPTGQMIRVTQDKKFKLPDGSTATEIDVVIVDFSNRYEYYPTGFDANNIQPPVCAAIGLNPDDMTPLESSTDKQAENCQVCTQNAFGSNGPAKACKNQRLLAVLPVDAKPDTPIMTIKVSPTGITGFDSYVNGVSANFNTPPIGVVTTISFNPAKSYASLQFGNAQPNPNLPVHFARQGEAQAILSTPPDMTERQQVVAPPVARGRVSARQPAATARR
jgi:hypothetical protein